MEDKKTEYETKIEKLTFFRIFIVLLCEILFEFSFGLIFYIFTENEEYYNPETCKNLAYWCVILWKMYLIESSIAFICFLIGLFSLFYHKILLTKVYIGFNNTFKSLIFILSVIILAIVTIVYNEDEHCNQLGNLAFIWLIFHYSLLSVACCSCCIILVVTGMIYRRSKKRTESERTSILLLNS